MSEFLQHSGLEASDCGTLMLKTPAESGYRMPAERTPHECCWMAWPSRAEQWPDGLAGAQRTYARSRARYGVSNPCAWWSNRIASMKPAHSAARASSSLRCRSTILGCVIAGPRSSLTATVRVPGPLGGSTPGAASLPITPRMHVWRDGFLASARPVYQSSLCLEGGGIHTDGEGTVITTECRRFECQSESGDPRVPLNVSCVRHSAQPRLSGCRAIRVSFSSTSLTDTSTAWCRR